MIEPEDNPSPDHPIHHLSPDSAMTIAGLLGCRLPTTDEWRAAAPRQDHVGAGEGPAKLQGDARGPARQDRGLEPGAPAHGSSNASQASAGTRNSSSAPSPGGSASSRA